MWGIFEGLVQSAPLGQKYDRFFCFSKYLNSLNKFIQKNILGIVHVCIEKQSASFKMENWIFMICFSLLAMSQRCWDISIKITNYFLSNFRVFRWLNVLNCIYGQNLKYIFLMKLNYKQKQKI